jgi:hypothetical protein
MRKIVLLMLLLFLGLAVNAQVTKIVTSVNEAGDVASFDLDCSKRFPTLAKGLKYNITRHEFKGPELKNTYNLMLVMDGFYTTTLNEVMTISVIFSDGTKVSKIKTLENDGYFDGACTINMKSPPELSLKFFIKKVIINTDTKEVVYEISSKKSQEFRKNIENIVNAK